ncbi:FMN reductase [NAD(P)H] [bioreactor metagenome]|uniref:FMN reductase [NAD(P)H] n=1 Tax=bioreactor metagenome TaxID=1076179 RepID=A0A645E7K4_9ZZZZ
MSIIYQRRSVRSYTGEPVTDEQITELLRAAMAAPSAKNRQPWDFVISRDNEKLKQVSNFHSFAKMLHTASAAIIVCGHKNPDDAGFWVQDCAAATENILLRATELGIGSVWIGIYPKVERVEGVREIFGIPNDIFPLSIVSLGYPLNKHDPVDRFDPRKIHKETW